MKENKLIFVYINENYLNYLKKYDVKVPEKKNRIYIGALLRINNKEYFAPLSSPKEKHKTMKNNIDIFKIKNGKLGIVNLNNMIPVLPDDKCRETINLTFLKNSNDKKDNQYFYLLNDQLRFCKKNEKQLLEKAENIHKIFIQEFDKLENWQKKMYTRVNNFKLLEFACEEYQRKYIKENNRDQKELAEIARMKNWSLGNILKINNIGINGLTEEEKESLTQAIEELEENKLVKYCSGSFDNQQLISITDAIYDKLDNKQMELLANPEFDRWQMNEIRKGFEAGLPYEVIKKYANPEINDKEMSKMREKSIEKKTKVVMKKINFKKKKDKEKER